MMRCTKFARSSTPERVANGPSRHRRVARSIRSLHEIETLLGDRPMRRDLLIEHLHLIQDTYKQISATHLAALADVMKLAPPRCSRPRRSTRTSTS